MRMIREMVGALLVVMAAAAWCPASAQQSPAAAAEALLEADRRFSAAAAGTDAVTALTSMFVPAVIMPGPPGRLHRGLEAVTESLRANPDNDGAHLEWTPIRVGLSADGQQGFTFGFMTLRRKDGTRLPLKYMSYWIKGDAGWRVIGYKRARRPEGDVALTPMAPLLPAALAVPARVPTTGDPMAKRLAEAERAFSNEAQQIGLGAAFTKWGSETAVNMGGPDSAGYVVGPAAIGRSVGASAPGTTSPVEWSSDVTIVASSADLGISFGYIRPNAKPADGKPVQGTPFFTIWHRPTPDAPWRYIAE
jgi:ketosteroid isomerase-like protein